MGEIRSKRCEGVGITWSTRCFRMAAISPSLSSSALPAPPFELAELRDMDSSVRSTFFVASDAASSFFSACPKFRLKSPDFIYKSSKNVYNFSPKSHLRPKLGLLR